jgi:hypothetical protein
MMIWNRLRAYHNLFSQDTRALIEIIGVKADTFSRSMFNAAPAT